MRFYLKLVLLTAIFVYLANCHLCQTLNDFAYEVRVAYVFAFGSAADLTQLIDDTQQAMARERGNMDLYLRGKRFQKLMKQRLAEVAARGLLLNEAEHDRIVQECQREAFGSPRAAQGRLSHMLQTNGDVSPKSDESTFAARRGLVGAAGKPGLSVTRSHEEFWSHCRTIYRDADGNLASEAFNDVTPLVPAATCFHGPPSLSSARWR